MHLTFNFTKLVLLLSQKNLVLSFLNWFVPNVSYTQNHCLRLCFTWNTFFYATNQILPLLWVFPDNSSRKESVSLPDSYNTCDCIVNLSLAIYWLLWQVRFFLWPKCLMIWAYWIHHEARHSATAGIQCARFRLHGPFSTERARTQPSYTSKGMCFSLLRLNLFEWDDCVLMVFLMLTIVSTVP